MSVSGVETNINLSAILASARNVVKDAKKQGRLDDITVRMVRQEVERVHALKKGTLDAEEYKRELTKVVYNLIEEFDISETEERGATTTVDHSKTLQIKRDSDDKENLPQKSFKKHEESTMLSRKRQQEYKSKEFIDSSDDEDNKAESSRSAQKSSTSVSNQRESSKRSTISVAGGEAKLDDSTVFEDEKNGVGHKSSNLIPVKRTRSKGKSKEIQKKPKKEQNSSEKSDSQRKSAKQLLPQEETIKRLKALVVACGVRKQWKREFQDLETATSQIARLKTILHDLGMTGRMSMEQAKAIKAKRDFEQEMKDVLEFAGKHSSAAVKGDSEESSGNDESDSESEEDEDVSNIRKRRPKLNNVDSLQAFLAGQSDDD